MQPNNLSKEQISNIRSIVNLITRDEMCNFRDVTTRDRTPPSRNEGSQTTLHIYLTEIFGTNFFLNCSANTHALHSSLTKHSTVHPVYYYIWESTHICVRIHMQIICILAICGGHKKTGYITNHNTI